jgi:NAD(P)H dehydrogenase (quinone)
MQILVLYHSRSGNTKSLAEAVAEGAREVEGVSVIMKTPVDVRKEDFVDSQGVVIGSPVYFGTMASEIKRIIDEFVVVRRSMEGKVGAAFATSADASGGKETTVISILQALLIYGMIVVGDPLSTGGHYGAASQGNPTTADIKEAESLGRRVAELVKKLFSTSS